jgi:deoxyribodipyrimidine photo-lyase
MNLGNQSLNIFWFRRDFRLEDNAGLYYALKKKLPLQCIFIFDTNILNQLTNKSDRRVNFIHQQIYFLKNQLKGLGSDLAVFYGNPVEIWHKIIAENKIHSVFCNHDYEPYAISRDEAVKQNLAKQDIQFFSYKDQVIFEKNEVLKQDGTPYTIYTPYSKKWLEKLNDFYLKNYPCEKYFANFQKGINFELPSIKEIGFQKTEFHFPNSTLETEIIKTYHKTRDIPSNDKGTSRLGLHLRFGTVSIRKIAQAVKSMNETYLKELIWREFFMQILWHFPHVKEHSFRREYDRIEWRNNLDEFEKWCNGQTGYPIVDAGMRELNATGYMHNRVRMITASFLTKHLLIDWRWGEAYFAEKLLDFELSANNGNWQWAAGTGCDAAPYFRVFNPHTQNEKFDPQNVYVRKWVPEFQSSNYPKPIVDHKFARERALATYKKALSQK